MKVYLDNGATSYPKAPGVKEAISSFFDNVGSSVNRGSYDTSLAAERVVYETREMICQMYNYDNTNNVVFTKNITESLNIILKGFLRNGDNVIVSSIEHNAVMRPLVKLREKGITITRITCNESGELDTKEIESAINEKTKLIVMTHCSNVSGSVVDLEAVGKIAKANDLYFVIDAAQTSGVIDVDMQKLNADAICFTGHKSLLGPQGIGGFIINDRMHPLVDTFIEGGTGSHSESEEQPDYMPDKFESGTPNIIGIYGLNASLKYINEVGKEGILKHEMHLVEKFLSGLRKFEKIRVVGRQDTENRLAVISVNFDGEDNSEIAHVLSSKFGIATRVGLHCAPSAHQTFGTYETGTVRFSFSSFNTDEEIDYTLDAIKQIMDSL